MPIDEGTSVPRTGGGAGVVGGIVGGLASIYDTYQSNKTAKENTNKTIAANQAEAEKAYQREIEMWNMQNAYNSPAAQMARYQEAGLNPHMVGQSGTGAGNATTMPKYNPPNIQYRYEAPQPGSGIASILPVIMQVGSWMQNMRYTEEQIKGQKITNLYKVSQDMRLKQLIDYLESANPEMLSKLRNQKRLLAYQGSTEQHRTGKESWLEKAAYGKVLSEYGGDFAQYHMRDGKHEPIGGMAAQRAKLLANQISISGSKAQVEAAHAAYADYGVTNPQQLINLVVGSALSGLKGSPVRINPNRRQVPESYKSKYNRLLPKYKK